MFALLERSDGAAVNVLSSAANQRPPGAAENINEGRSVLAILPPCGSRDLDVLADDFQLILSPRADFLHEEAVVADHVSFGIKCHIRFLGEAVSAGFQAIAEDRTECSFSRPTGCRGRDHGRFTDQLLSAVTPDVTQSDFQKRQIRTKYWRARRDSNS